jgi:hypothetical protein
VANVKVSLWDVTVLFQSLLKTRDGDRCCESVDAFPGEPHLKGKGNGRAYEFTLIVQTPKNNLLAFR